MKKFYVYIAINHNKLLKLANKIMGNNKKKIKFIRIMIIIYLGIVICMWIMLYVLHKIIK